MLLYLLDGGKISVCIPNSYSMLSMKKLPFGQQRIPSVLQRERYGTPYDEELLTQSCNTDDSSSHLYVRYMPEAHFCLMERTLMNNNLRGTCKVLKISYS